MMLINKLIKHGEEDLTTLLEIPLLAEDIEIHLLEDLYLEIADIDLQLMVIHHLEDQALEDQALEDQALEIHHIQDKDIQIMVMETDTEDPEDQIMVIHHLEDQVMETIQTETAADHLVGQNYGDLLDPYYSNDKCHLHFILFN